MKTQLMILSLFVASAACSRTTVVESWKRPDYQAPAFEKVLVVGVAQIAAEREIFEKAMVSALAEQGITAEASGPVLPPNAERMQREELKAAVVSMGFDAAVVMSLLDAKSKVVEGGYPTQSFGSIYTNYPTMYGEQATPDVAKETVQYILEARLYDLAATGVVWRTQTETIDPKDIDSFAVEFANAVAKRMAKDRVIAR